MRIVVLSALNSAESNGFWGSGWIGCGYNQWWSCVFWCMFTDCLVRSWVEESFMKLELRFTACDGIEYSMVFKKWLCNYCLIFVYIQWCLSRKQKVCSPRAHQ